MSRKHGSRAQGWRICILAPLFAFLLAGCGMLRPAPDAPAPVKAQKVVHTAYSQMGKKYTYGGASPNKGFDCSGLIWWAYRQNGLEVPRVTVDQAKTGRAVPKNMARPGDIVVFRTSRSPRGLHTGIYAGGDSFIHSPRRGERVRMESINVPYWSQKLISVRRIVR